MSQPDFRAIIELKVLDFQTSARWHSKFNRLRRDVPRLAIVVVIAIVIGFTNLSLTAPLITIATPIETNPTMYFPYIRCIFPITGNGALMGSALPNCGKKSFHISLKGENKFKAIDLFKNFELQKRFTPGSDQFDADLEIEDETPAFWHLRATQIDNHIAYSSPIWFE